MKKNKGLILLLCSLLFCFAGCQANLSFKDQALENEGLALVYMEPFPQEAARLRFELGGISAIREDGTEIPLSLSLREVKGGDMRRQKRVASAPLPPGTYRGLSFTVKNAFLLSDDQEAALMAPETPSVMELHFQVNRKKAAAFFLVLNYKESVKGGFSFTPVFSLFMPGRPAPARTGYVSNRESGTVTVFDKISGEAVGALVTGREPKGIALDPARGIAYIALSEDDIVEAVDMETGETINSVRLTPGDSPQDLALVADGKTLFAVDAGSNTLSVIDPLSFIESGRITVGRGPNSILLDRTRAKTAYVFNTVSSSISVVDIPTRTLTTTVSTETGPLRGELNRKGDRLYAIYESSPYLLVMETDPPTFRIVTRVLIGPQASFLKVDANTDMLYVARKGGGDVEVYDPFSFIPVDFIKTGSSGIAYLTIDGESNNLYALAPENRTLTAVGINSKKAVFVIDVGEAPYGVAVMGER